MSTRKPIISGVPPGFILKPVLLNIFLITSSWHKQYQAEHWSFYTSRTGCHPEGMTLTGLKISNMKQDKVKGLATRFGKAHYQYRLWDKLVEGKSTCMNCWTKCWTWASSMHLHTRKPTISWVHARSLETILPLLSAVVRSYLQYCVQLCGVQHQKDMAISTAP